ncbi:hypothetical protein Bca52824_017722 [Brassica carinata]|uniref:RNase H type-1 domain-containing protein n=1 Tax=Brassica carinata TaxID=52824 RepID=A0A8X7VNN5_BRACI|nr:hypothetical protein Bca52824_017722 [Brassica carinata]
MGSAWLARDSHGIPLFHSRRAFAPVDTLVEAELRSLKWAVEALHDLRVKRVIVEISSPTLEEAIFSPHRLPKDVNIIATEIATSFTMGHRYQSYVAKGGPSWLSSHIRAQAVEAMTCFSLPGLLVY